MKENIYYKTNMKASSIQVSIYFPHRKLRRTKVIFFIILRGNLQGGKQKCTLYNIIENNEYWRHILEDKHIKKPLQFRSPYIFRIENSEERK